MGNELNQTKHYKGTDTTKVQHRASWGGDVPETKHTSSITLSSLFDIGQFTCIQGFLLTICNSAGCFINNHRRTIVPTYGIPLYLGEISVLGL